MNREWAIVFDPQRGMFRCGCSRQMDGQMVFELVGSYCQTMSAALHELRAQARAAQIEDLRREEAQAA